VTNPVWVDDRMRDGRNVDESLGTLEGEAASVEVKRPDEAYAARTHALDVRPAEATGATYYDLPAIKEPVWISTIPAYFFTGGVAGGSLVLGAAMQLGGDDDHGTRDLVRTCRWLGLGATIASSGLLIYDLGRPSRFFEMLRVFRPTSPMSVGSWVLATTGAFATLALLPGPFGDAPAIVAGMLGIPLAGYTAVLIANTAVPVWQQSRRALPFLFIAGAIASTSSVLDLFSFSRRAQTAVRRFGVVGKCAELFASLAVEREASSIADRVADPLRSGPSGALWNVAKALTAASLLVSILPGRSQWKRATAGVLGILGTVAMRFGVFHAGKSSARDPRATFQLQRAQMTQTSEI